MNTNNSTTIHSSINTTIALLSSGLIATAFGHPMDLVRVRVLYGNEVEKITSVKKGISFTLSMSVIKFGSLWAIQEKIEESFKNMKISNQESIFYSGLLSNIIPNIVFAPFNIVRVHLMRDQEKKSLFKIACNIYKKFGASGFFKGTSMTVFRDVIWGGLYFPIANHIDGNIQKKYSTLTEIETNAISTFSAAIIATSVTAVLDSARLHQMNEDKVQKPFSQHLIHSLKPTRSNFISNLIVIFRVSSTVCIGHTTYRYIIDHLNKKGEK